MSLIDDMQPAMDDFYSLDNFGETVTVGGNSVLALVNDPRQTSEQGIPISNVELTLTVRRSELTTVSNGTTAVVRGVTYRVTGDPLPGRLEWTLDLSRDMVSL